MQEDLLHYIWKYKKLQLEDLLTSDGKTVSIVDVGTHNHLAGPDFFNSRIHIDGQLWAGNVEIHMKASDWYAHSHEKDPNYNNVILHVVWEDDASVFRSNNSEVPTLELKRHISKNILEAYQQLFDKKGIAFINCEKDIRDIEGFIFHNWLERLYFERLERKSNLVMELLHQSKNDWEKVFFTMLLKSFGSKINGDSFFTMAQALDFSVVRKTQSNVLQLESILMGMAGLLADDAIVDAYYISLKKEYQYLKNKFDIQDGNIQKPDFFKLRPSNFPTVRLSQLANLYFMHQNIFSKVIGASTLEEIYTVFDVSASEYWDNHFTFGKISKKSKKKLTRKFIDIIIINTILPLKFCYARHLGNDVNEGIVQIISNIKKEENGIVGSYITHGVKVKNAKESQAILQLYNEYCTKNKCLQCVVGNGLLSRNN